MKTFKAYSLQFFSLLLLLMLVLISCDEDDENTIKDGSNNSYETVTIGTQVWMAENLKTTKYNDGTEIPLITDKTDWYYMTTPAYCWHDNNSGNKNIYGGLYNWYTINTGKLCPKGWRIPTDNDWSTLMTFLGGDAIAGGKLKKTGTSHWTSPNTGATNESGFAALPGSGRGQYFVDANFGPIGNGGYWWSSTSYNENSVWIRFIFYNSESVSKNTTNKTGGFSVRCIKD
jgi:uncharacterized protein (TIGR02145 family)